MTDRADRNSENYPCVPVNYLQETANLSLHRFVAVCHAGSSSLPAAFSAQSFPDWSSHASQRHQQIARALDQYFRHATAAPGIAHRTCSVLFWSIDRDSNGQAPNG